ncbi:glycosyltransferase family 4 protein [Vibrio breoganii]|nr:glycosyltransferase family 4 protein [Vibrio breoganii]PMI17142.1 hypothetical protein BCU49_13765 [Vibrio breoganii]
MNRNILLLSNAYYPSIGGIENSLRHLSDEAFKCGDTPKIIVSDIGVPKDHTNQLSELVQGVEVRRYPLSPKKSWLKAFNFLFSSLEHYKLLKKEKIELGEKNTVVIARFHYSAYLAYLAGFRNVKYIVPSIYKNQMKVEVNKSFLQKIKQKAQLLIHNHIQKSALKYSENYVFSETMKNQCITLTGDRCKQYTVTKPGVDNKRFYPLISNEKNNLRQKLGLPIDKTIVLFVGRFVAAKGVSLLIDAFSSVDDDALLVLVGEGKEHDIYIEKIMDLGIGEKVRIFPPVRDVEKYYQCADLFAMTSNYEPLGQTILEAMACGLKVIAFRPSHEVDTAINELSNETSVAYVEEFSSVSLYEVLRNEINAIDLVDINFISESTINSYSWSALYTRLVK